MQTQLRLATPADSASLAAIHAAAFPPSESWSSDVFSLQTSLPNVIGLWTDNAVILLRVADQEAEILTLAVAPAARRQRVATAMLQEAIVRLAAAGAFVVFLEVSVKNTAGLGLYTKCGFTQVGRRPHYYSDGADALVMRLDLQRNNRDADR